MKIGADIECFLRDSDDQIINAANQIKQSRENPYKKQKIKIHHDNVLAEFSIPVCENGKEFFINITNGLYLLEKLSHPYKMDFSAASSISDAIMKDKNATENGCNDETNAYTLTLNTEIESFIKIANSELAVDTFILDLRKMMSYLIQLLNHCLFICLICF